MIKVENSRINERVRDFSERLEEQTHGIIDRGEWKPRETVKAACK